MLLNALILIFVKKDDNFESNDMFKFCIRLKLHKISHFFYFTLKSIFWAKIIFSKILFFVIFEILIDQNFYVRITRFYVLMLVVSDNI